MENDRKLDKLNEILEYYEENHSVDDVLDEVKQELIENNVVVKGDSFFCPIWKDEINGWLLLAGTKDSADLWVMKEIIKLIKSGDTIYSLLNGNIDYLVKKLRRYNVEVLNIQGGIAYIAFNLKE